MAELGMCVNARDAIPDRAECAALGVKWIRTNVDGSLELIDDMLGALPPDVQAMITLNNQCREVGADWKGWENACHMVALLAGKWPGRIKIVGCANELDIYYANGETALSPAFAADLVRRAAPILRPAGIKVAMSSVASGSWPGYLRDMAALCQGAADYADIHLYMKSVNHIPEDPGWQTAEAALRQAASLSGLPVISSEAGIKARDAGGELWQGKWAAGLAALPSELICYWCFHDKMASPGETGDAAFGAHDLDGRVKPVWTALQAMFGGPIVTPPVVPPSDKFWVGEGLRAAMQKRGDVAIGSEEYLTANLSMAPGDQAAYWWCAASRTVRVVPWEKP